jgi:hypothetical protein
MHLAQQLHRLELRPIRPSDKGTLGATEDDSDDHADVGASRRRTAWPS